MSRDTCKLCRELRHLRVHQIGPDHRPVSMLILQPAARPAARRRSVTAVPEQRAAPPRAPCSLIGWSETLYTRRARIVELRRAFEVRPPRDGAPALRPDGHNGAWRKGTPKSPWA